MCRGFRCKSALRPGSGIPGGLPYPDGLGLPRHGRFCDNRLRRPFLLPLAAPVNNFVPSCRRERSAVSVERSAIALPDVPGVALEAPPLRYPGTGGSFVEARSIIDPIRIAVSPEVKWKSPGRASGQGLPPLPTLPRVAAAGETTRPRHQSWGAVRCGASAAARPGRGCIGAVLR